jgi:hypothetical protein
VSARGEVGNIVERRRKRIVWYVRVIGGGIGGGVKASQKKSCHLGFNVDREMGLQRIRQGREGEGSQGVTGWNLSEES